MFRIVLARQGQTMESGTLVRWCKAVDDAFNIGDVLYEVESEKAVIEIQATRPGRLVRLQAVPDDVVPVGAVLAIAAEPGEELTAAAIDALAVAPNEPGAESEESAKATPADGAVLPAVAPRAPTAIVAMPKARALAKELGVDLSAVAGSGVDGLITADDVRRAAATRAASPAAADGPPGADARIARKVALTAIGRSVLAALERGAGIPQFTQGILVDATELVRRKDAAGDSLTYLDFFLDALVRAAREVPEVLARIADRELQYYADIDISIAAATDHGLLLAVLLDAGSQSLAERASAWRSLVERARGGRLTPREATGGLIALSNLGTRGVDYGTPLLPADHSAIVFFGSLEKRPIVRGDAIEARPSVHVAITYDHRVVDGVLGARFTTAVRRALEATT
jgi:pyruvate dehydrogenase E2 component (dihydrolipoamide acetyltransferase)